MRRLQRDLAEPAPIPTSAIRRATDIMASGQLTRYGEFRGAGSEVAALERDFADYLGCRYAVATNSGGSALHIALLAAGVRAGDAVLMNAFTLAPVPAAIVRAGATPLYVECGQDYLVDLDDLVAKAGTGASYLLLSHMRGHIADMGHVTAICRRHHITLIEDCAHTLGASWDGMKSGRFGAAGCFSLQSYKHINAGEGGLIATDDDDIAARAILYSGSYMLYTQHGTVPEPAVFERYRHTVPNLSCRMGEVTAALARPQIALLAERGRAWNQRYAWLAEALSAIEGVRVPRRDPQEHYIASSIQFSLDGLDAGQIAEVIARCGERGVGIKWFGRPEPQGFTSTWRHWAYVEPPQALPKTERMLATLCDMRIPLSLTAEDCSLIADIIADSIRLARLGTARQEQS